MGIYDREYYRDESSGSGLFSGVAPACKAIILVNIGLFLAGLIVTNVDTFYNERLSLNADLALRHWEVYRLLTAAFLHQSAPVLLIVNMLFLWFAGKEVEAAAGSRDFTAMYLTAAMLSSLCAALAELARPSAGVDPIVLGSSGPVFAVLVAHMVQNPHRGVMVMGWARLEMWMVAALYVLIAFLSRTQLFVMQGIAPQPVPPMLFLAAVLGGGAYGALFKSQDLRWSRLVRGQARRPRFRVVSAEPRDKVSPLSSASQSRSASSGSARPSTGLSYADEDQLDARLDEVLAKIAREGRGGLTDEEKRILEEASQRARSRRSDRL